MAELSRFYVRYGKRAFDLILTIPVLILLAPFLSAIGLLVALRMGPPVLFRQARPGYHNRAFTLYKFRTMTNVRDARGNLLPDAERLTSLGRFLRSTSLDELPELINVLCGDMSLIGPRPLLMEYLDIYTPEQMRRHQQRPGITGLAQISGRQSIPFSRRLELDVWYVDHVSLLLDVRILMDTLPGVLRSRGVVLGQDVSTVDDLGLSRRATQRRDRSA